MNGAMQASNQRETGRRGRVRRYLRQGRPIWPQYSMRQRRLYAFLVAAILFLGFELAALLNAGNLKEFVHDAGGQLAFAIPLSLVWLGLGLRQIATSRQFMALVGVVTLVSVFVAGFIGSGIA